MAIILGALANVPKLEVTVNTNYLSTNMAGWVKDFADSPNGDWIDGYHPYVTDLGVNLSQAALTFHLHTPTLCPITAGHIAKSYLYDWYFRIHVVPNQIDLGNVLSDQTHYVEVWNAYFNTNLITSITDLELSNVTRVLNKVLYDPYTNTTGYTPLTIPYTYNALETTQVIITVPQYGTPILQGALYFNFTSESPTLDLVGRRVILWPYSSFRKFNETRNYLTDIIECRASEERLALREVPRLSLECDNAFPTQEEYTSARLTANKVANLPLALPLWTDAVKLVNLIASQLDIYFNTANLELAVSYPVVFWKNWNTWEIQEIKSIYSNRIVLKNPLNSSYTSCWIAPIIIGYPDGSVKVEVNGEGFKRGSLKIISADCFTSASTTATLFQGFYIWDRKTVLTGGISYDYSRKNVTSDTPTGMTTKFDLEVYNRQVSKLSTIINGVADLYTVRRMFDVLKGRYATFWLPSGYTDITPVSTITIGIISLVVVYNNFTAYPVKYIYVVGADAGKNTITEAFEITNTANNHNGTESLAFAIAATKNFNTITSISILLKLRLDSDALEYKHDKDITLLNVAVKEVL